MAQLPTRHLASTPHGMPKLHLPTAFEELNLRKAINPHIDVSFRPEEHNMTPVGAYLRQVRGEEPAWGHHEADVQALLPLPKPSSSMPPESPQVRSVDTPANNGTPFTKHDFQFSRNLAGTRANGQPSRQLIPVPIHSHLIADGDSAHDQSSPCGSSLGSDAAGPSPCPSPQPDVIPTPESAPTTPEQVALHHLQRAPLTREMYKTLHITYRAAPNGGLSYEDTCFANPGAHIHDLWSQFATAHLGKGDRNGMRGHRPKHFGIDQHVGRADCELRLPCEHVASLSLTCVV